VFAARQYTPAKAAFERLRTAVSNEDRDLVRLRLAEVDYYLKRTRPAREALKPYAENGPRQSEAMYFYALVSRDLGDRDAYSTMLRRVVDEFPTDRWAEEELNPLATSYIRDDDDDQADKTFRELCESFPPRRFLRNERRGKSAGARTAWATYRETA
jgi:TolA-binding protein